MIPSQSWFLPRSCTPTRASRSSSASTYTHPVSARAEPCNDGYSFNPQTFSQQGGHSRYQQKKVTRSSGCEQGERRPPMKLLTLELSGSAHLRHVNLFTPPRGLFLLRKQPVLKTTLDRCHRVRTLRRCRKRKRRGETDFTSLYCAQTPYVEVVSPDLPSSPNPAVCQREGRNPGQSL